MSHTTEPRIPEFTWQPSTRERYYEMLNVLPPVEWHRGRPSLFLVGEAMLHNDAGEPCYTVHRCYFNEFTVGSRPVSVAEFNLLSRSASPLLKAPAISALTCTTSASRKVSSSNRCQASSVEEHDVEGFGETVQAALDACADEAELVEADADEVDGDEEDE